MLQLAGIEELNRQFDELTEQFATELVDELQHENSLAVINSTQQPFHVPFHCRSWTFSLPFLDLSLPATRTLSHTTSQLFVGRLGFGVAVHLGGWRSGWLRQRPLPCASTAFVAKTPPFALRFHCLRG